MNKMALKLRKDIKKSSYYVWFLGAKESKGLRGSEFIIPVIKHLEEREKDIEPFKVTLQVSHKGLKIIQNIVSTSQNPSKSKPKNETIKHFIPHNTITCVYQHDDIIACILLLFNPVTKCPLHVHAYRCDSLETASVLKQQLQTLIERPENQKKLAEIESRLKKEVKKLESSIGSDTGTSTRESESSSEERYQVETSRVTNLYDSVAAELRQKLNKNNVPILLPPRDYDTVHRQKGNLTGIELRRCLNANIVGQNVKNSRISSGGSSGIGSDHPPSPESPEVVTDSSRFNTLDNHSTSDEDWSGDPDKNTIYLMHTTHQMTLPRPVHLREKSPDQRYNDKTRCLEKPIAKFTDNKYLNDRQKTSLERQKSDRYYETKQKFCELERRYGKECVNNKREKTVKYFEDDGFDENFRYRSKSDYERRLHDFPRKYNEPPIPKLRQKYVEENNRRLPQYRQRSPSPLNNEMVSPRDRFKDAKEKFLLMEKERMVNERREQPISVNLREKPLKRHESMMMYDNRNGYFEEHRPKPAPRAMPEDVRFRYRSDKFDPNRRSMFNLIEEEHRKNSSEIAKELKRRSYMENDYPDSYSQGKCDYFSKSNVDLDKIGYVNKKNNAGFRHSFAEPIKMTAKLDKKKIYPDMALQRTNSVSTNGRVGIASVQPY